jgi:hypothetical protein
MSKTTLQLRRGSTTDNSTFTGAAGEVIVNTTTNSLIVHDGTTVGGWPQAPLTSPVFTGTPTAPTATSGTNTTQIATTAFVQTAVNAVSFAGVTTSTITEGSNLYFTTARARSSVSATGSISYNSTTGVFSYTAPTVLSAFTNDVGYLTSNTVLNSLSVVSSPSGALTYDPTHGVFTFTQAVNQVNNQTGNVVLTTDNIAQGTGANKYATLSNLQSVLAGGGVTNSMLANSTITVNGSTLTLGGTSTITAAANTLTGTTINSAVVSSSLTSVGTLVGLLVGATGTASTVVANPPVQGGGSSAGSVSLTVPTGSIVANNLFTVSTDASGYSAEFQSWNLGAGTAANSSIAFKSARGTPTVPLNAQLGDTVGNIDFFSYQNSQSALVGSQAFVVTSAPSGSSPSNGQFSWKMTDSTGTFNSPQLVASLTSKGLLTTNAVQVTTAAAGAVTLNGPLSVSTTTYATQSITTTGYVATVTFNSASFNGYVSSSITSTFNGYIVGSTLTVTSNPTTNLSIGYVITSGTAGIPSGTYISSYGSGLGGQGTYTLSASATVGSSVSPVSMTGTQVTLTVTTAPNIPITLGYQISSNTAGLTAGTIIISQQGGTNGGIGTYLLNIAATVGSSGSPATFTVVQTTVPYAVGTYITIAGTQALGAVTGIYNGTWQVTVATNSTVSFALVGQYGNQAVAGSITGAPTAGTAGQVLASTGSATAPTWTSLSAVLPNITQLDSWTRPSTYNISLSGSNLVSTNTINGGNTLFTPTNNGNAVTVNYPIQVLMYKNGVYQQPWLNNSRPVWNTYTRYGDYTVTAGSIVFMSPPQYGDIINATVMIGNVTNPVYTTYPFNALDIATGT